MRRSAVLLAAAALWAGEARYARLGEQEGKVETRADSGSPWQTGLRNAPLGDSAWIRTAAGARAEVELDDGGVLRLGPDSVAELSDYTRLSTGQRVTLISLDRGLAYFTGAAEGRDSLIVAVPGAEAAMLRGGARLRLEARENSSQVAVIEGVIRFSSPAAELDIKEGRTVRVEPAQTSRFFLYNEIAALESDAWSEERDKTLAAASGAHTPGLKAGLADLSAGVWIDTADFGTVWKPKAAAGWAPFRNGKWAWHDTLGYTWISAEPWGWLPYHYGRWWLHETSGWVWVPGKDDVFSPGDVYWLRGSGLVAWGPLAPGEAWTPPERPRLYLAANTTYAPFAPDAREIDPAGFTPPKQPALAFIPAPPSPALSASRWEARRTVRRAGRTRLAPHLPGVSYEDRPAEPAAPPPAPVSQTTVIQPEPAAPVIISMPPPQPPAEVYYPVPVSTGIIVINPPDRESHRNYRRQEPPPAPKPQPPAPAPAPARVMSTPAARPVPVTLPRNEAPRPRVEKAEEKKPEAAKPEEKKPEAEAVTPPAGERVRRKQ